MKEKKWKEIRGKLILEKNILEEKKKNFVKHRGGMNLSLHVCN